MTRELQDRVLAVLEQATRRKVYRDRTPEWLQRPGREDCGSRWRLIRRIYSKLSDGLVLPDEMPARESRAIDGAIGGRGRPYQLVEVDESQHFNDHRSTALGMYPADVPLGFPRGTWIKAGKGQISSAGGGWGAPKPPLFPMAGGRHRQRAFRDALADLLPDLYGYGPTIRIADFEVEPWIWDQRGAARRLATLVETRIAAKQPTTPPDPR